jgi:hypothetical protein
MTLKEKINQELTRLADADLSSAAVRELHIQHDGTQLQCQIEALDRLGCAVEHLQVVSPALASASLARLHEISQAVAAKLTYLLEPIAVIETDQEERSVQMRSSPPQREGRHSSYYELVAGRGRLDLRRYCKEPGQSRTPVAAHLTREVLCRLAGDLVSAAN